MKKQNFYKINLTLLFIVVLGIMTGARAAVRPALISAAPTGAAGNGRSYQPSISNDGRFIAFTSTATNLVSGLNPGNVIADVFLRDTQTGAVRCVSKSTAGDVTGNAASFGPLVTPNGRYVIFRSIASNLVANDTNGWDDIFRYDTQTDQIEMVSVNFAGTNGGNANSGLQFGQNASFDSSDDGRYIAFASRASDLTNLIDQNGQSDVFVRDMITHTTRLVSINTNNNSAVNGTSEDLSISADGQVVAFESGAPADQMVAGVTDFGGPDGTSDIFVRDLRTNQTKCASLGNSTLLETANSNSFSAILSKDGSRVAFISLASDLAWPDTNTGRDVFVYDTGLNTTTLVSVNSAGTSGGNGESPFGNFPDSLRLSISYTGRYVAFESRASDLVSGLTDTGSRDDVFRRDLATGRTEAVSVTPAGNQTGDDFSDMSNKGTAMSRDGRFVTFSSVSSNLTAESFPHDASSAVFVRDMQTRYTTALTLNLTGSDLGNSSSFNEKISGNGKSVAFVSLATDLTVTDLNNDDDVYVSRVSAPQRAVADFDGDGLTDFAVFRPTLNGVWYVLNNPATFASYRYYGAGSDLLAPADYDGDGRTDYAVFRPSNGTWYISNGLTFNETITQFGVGGDKPLPQDYDGDGHADTAVYRGGTWWWQSSLNGQVNVYQFGLPTDIPTPGDFDGDTKADYAVFRPSNGTWYVRKSSDGAFLSVNFGLAGDKPVPADYDGDGRTDIAVFRGGTWYILRSADAGVSITQFGLAADIPTPGSFDADGKADIAVFRPADGTWYVLRSSNNAFSAAHFGQNGDAPVPSAFIP